MNGDSAQWFKFDDEDVTAFDQLAIETECFGGKVKETKLPNGQIQIDETEQFANALMLFYEKIKPARFDVDIDCRMDYGEIGKDNNEKIKPARLDIDIDCCLDYGEIGKDNNYLVSG